MGNTCGCIDPAEKQGEVKVDNKNPHTRQAQLNNYRNSTLSQGNQAQPV